MKMFYTRMGVITRRPFYPPFLFAICAKRLSALTQGVVETQTIHAARMRVNGSEISHLFFAEHSLLFAQGSVEEV